MGYTVDYIAKPATPERVQGLLDQMDRDLVKLEQFEALYGTYSNAYRGTVERLRNTYYLAETLAAQLPIDDDDDPDDFELKDFSEWARKQVRLTAGWSW